MKTKSITRLLIFGLLLSIWACQKDKFDGNPPVILLNGSQQLVDTIKLSTLPNYTFNFSIVDDRDWREMNVVNVQNGLVWYEGRIINSQPVNLPGITEGGLRYEAIRPGADFFSIEVADATGLRSSAEMHLLVLDNIPPVANLVLTQTNEVSPFQISIDGTNSFDGDSRWGGQIRNFEYQLFGFNMTQYPEGFIQYIYPGPGVYQVGLRVQDNDGEWSEWDIKSIEVK